MHKGVRLICDKPRPLEAYISTFLKTPISFLFLPDRFNSDKLFKVSYIGT